ncbi:501_t:CDS:2, partial [Acaulospora colombiana]
MAGQTATHTVAICKTIIDGKDHGIDWFVVPLRDRKTGKLVPGVVAGDMGDGTYTSPPNPALPYATLIGERLTVLFGTQIVLGQALTIACRYGCVRRQGSNDEKIMDYQTHYVKLMPGVASVYVINTLYRIMTKRWNDTLSLLNTNQSEFVKRIGDFHAMSSGFKGTLTWWGCERYVLGAFNDTAQGKKVDGSVAYLNDSKIFLEISKCSLFDEKQLFDLDFTLEIMTWLTIRKDLSDPLSKSGFQPNEYIDLVPILKKMGQLWSVHLINEYLDLFLEEEYFNKKQASMVRKVYLEMCKKAREEVIPLVDAWGYPDFILKAPLGRYDGDIYT